MMNKSTQTDDDKPKNIIIFPMPFYQENPLPFGSLPFHPEGQQLAPYYYDEDDYDYNDDTNDEDYVPSEVTTSSDCCPNQSV